MVQMVRQVADAMKTYFWIANTAMDVQILFENLFFRNVLIAAQASRCPEALEMPVMPPCPNNPKVQYFS